MTIKKINSEGLAPNSKTYTNKYGGRQSVMEARLDLLPPEAMMEIGKILNQGAVKYGENNWHKTTINENINHALNHIFAYLAGDTQDDHMGHAHCRLMFAHYLYLKKVSK